MEKIKEKQDQVDVVIVGTGVAGLFAALNLPRDFKIMMITKADLESSDSFLAQGGICVLRDESDYDSYFEDTMRAGHYENRKESVDIMIRSSQEIIRELIGYGVEFERRTEHSDDVIGDSDISRTYEYTREGAHSSPRILFHEDITGKEITGKLLARVKELDNVEIFEYTTMTDIIEEGGVCRGVVMQEQDGTSRAVRSAYTIVASGGIGGLYRHSTNFPHLTGDALEIAKKHGIRLEHTDYVQIHPTTLYSKKPGRRFLISESVRGEGAVLLDKEGNRFVNELLPRDVVTKAIREQMEKDGTDHVWLSMENIGTESILSHFPNIYRRCKEEGYDVTKEPIPVVPAQHYFMGGIWVDSDSQTSMERLFAAGETSCNGVHGANRLASNSLLESLVFAKRAAQKIGREKTDTAAKQAGENEKRSGNVNKITMKLQADHLIMEALKEDISSEDVSTNAVMKEAVPGEVDLICKEDGIIAGLDVFSRVFELLDENTKYYVNPTGRFVVGGPQGDCGLTGRKIIVDTYGGYASHGGGAFSGKDPTKVDRSAAYAARYVAKNVVASGIADKCEIQLAYAIGVAQPLSIYVNTYGTGKVSDEKIVEIIRENFDLRPAAIIKNLDLRRPIYKQTAAYGHFGRSDINVPWEKLDKVDVFKSQF